jgi:hypothetical protein
MGSILPCIAKVLMVAETQESTFIQLFVTFFLLYVCQKKLKKKHYYHPFFNRGIIRSELNKNIIGPSHISNYLRPFDKLNYAIYITDLMVTHV